MTHRLITALSRRSGRIPHTLDSPYAGTEDHASSRMWRLGWQRARDEHPGTPSEGETLKRMAEQLGWQ